MSGRRGRARSAAHLPVALAVLWLAACAPDPAADLPAGTLWAGEAAPARALLADLESFAGSPAALAARRLQQRLAGCDRFLAYCPAGEPCALAAQLVCEPTGELLRAADAVRGSAAWVLAHRTEQRRLTAWGTAQPGGAVTMRALLVEDSASPDPWQVLLPDGDPPAPPVLSDEGALLLMRLRSHRGAAAFAGLVAGDRAGELFGLRGDLFTRMALEGTTELALFEPAPGELIPPLALALHVRLREAAVRGMEAFLADVRARWPVTRTPWELDGRAGACLTDLNVLPGLAPCYLDTGRALVLGWNQRSVKLALAAPPPAERGTSALVLDLAGLPAADRLVRASFGGAGEGDVAARYPWSRLTVAGDRRRDGYHLSLRLEPPLVGSSGG